MLRHTKSVTLVKWSRGGLSGAQIQKIEEGVALGSILDRQRPSALLFVVPSLRLLATLSRQIERQEVLALRWV